ncbi:hypothetical protein [Roseivivax marinus]|uniref:hypothetical protein n=1 Tax=Roseivivax marinus TaxID=1379903 RepID=UPI00273F3C6E|nr:hypothetical protein [Roseivivax marinus]
MSVPSILDVIETCRGSDKKTVRQYGRHLEHICDMVARQRRHDLRQDDACLETYRYWVPKFDPRSAPTLERIAREGWAPKTYKQYAEDGRRAVEHVTGTLRARQERRARQDGWHALLSDAQKLADAGLVRSSRMKLLRRLADICRERELDLPDISRDTLIGWHGHIPRQHWTQVVNGAEALDRLLSIDTLVHHLPVQPLALASLELRGVNDVPEALVVEVTEWLRVATTSLPPDVNTPDGQAVLAKRHSKGAIGVFAAAMNAYLSTLGQRKAITSLNTIRGLFSDDDIEHVLVDWIAAHKAGKPSALSPRTIYRYADCLKLMLGRNGLPAPSTKIATSCTTYPILIEGRKANEFMAAETEAWCRELIGDPKKIAIFETQHVSYMRIAKEALAAAEVAGFDLVELADADSMKALPRKQRSAAKALLRNARVFGVCAAYAAIALEGAPFRKKNILGLTRNGARQTFFDNRKRQEGFTIMIPNEDLKNGEALTRRNQSIPPIQICGDAAGLYGEEVLTFYLEKIRPLFPRSAKSTYLFPSLEAAGLKMVDKTFDNWLLTASEAIGLPLTSHNFRHGYCSIEIKEDPNCIEDLSVVLGDRPGTIAKYYAFVDKIAVLRRHQERRSNRRAGYRVQNAYTKGIAA